MTSVGVQLSLVGQDAVLAAATVGHHDHPGRIETALQFLICSGREFSADHVRDLVPPDTRDWLKLTSIGPDGKVSTNGNVLSSIIGRASRGGRIQQTGWCQAARKERHANINRIWKGVRA